MSNEIKLFVGDEEICTLGEPLELTVDTTEVSKTSDSDFEYYMRRGNKYYFRNSFYKIIMEDPGFDITIKYGMKFKINHEV